MTEKRKKFDFTLGGVLDDFVTARGTGRIIIPSRFDKLSLQSLSLYNGNNIREFKSHCNNSYLWFGLVFFFRIIAFSLRALSTGMFGFSCAHYVCFLLLLFPAVFFLAHTS